MVNSEDWESRKKVLCTVFPMFCICTFFSSLHCVWDHPGDGPALVCDGGGVGRSGGVPSGRPDTFAEECERKKGGTTKIPPSRCRDHHDNEVVVET